MAIAPHLRPLTLEEYLALPEDGESGWEREVIRGRLYVAPRPMHLHQVVLTELLDMLRRYARRRGGNTLQIVLDADLLMDALSTYVSPDLMYFAPSALPVLRDLIAQRERIHVSAARPELVVEIISRGSETRDLIEKAHDYAVAGIPHYWALDPESRRFHEFVLPPSGGEYACITHTGRRVRPRLFAAERPPFVLNLSRLWQDLSG